MTEEQIMNITVIQKDFHWEKVRFVNARDLHKRLWVGRRFATRITERIKDYRFELETDYFTVPQIGNGIKERSDGQLIDAKTGRVIAVEYIMTIDMAKELCMVENNEVWKSIRKYFIRVEKEFRQVLQLAYQNPKFINQLSQSYIETRVEWKEYRKEFTDSIRDFVNDQHYGTYTDMIYDFLFEEKAGEYRELLSLSAKDATRDTMYSDILVIVWSIEVGFAEELEIKYNQNKQRLSKEEVVWLFREYINKSHWMVYKKNAMRIMATYDEQLRWITHKRMIDYKKDFTQEDIQKLLWK